MIWLSSQWCERWNLYCCVVLLCLLCWGQCAAVVALLSHSHSWYTLLVHTTVTHSWYTLLVNTPVGSWTCAEDAFRTANQKRQNIKIICLIDGSKRELNELSEPSRCLPGSTQPLLWKILVPQAKEPIWWKRLFTPPNRWAQLLAVRRL